MQNYNNALNSANSILASSPITWRHAWVAVDKAAILGFLGKEQQSLDAAKWGLAVVDGAHLDQEADPDFIRLLAVTKGERSNVKDALLSVIATRLIVKGSNSEADVYINQVVNLAIKMKLQRLKTLQRE
jgi:hypothetical protein